MVVVAAAVEGTVAAAPGREDEEEGGEEEEEEGGRGESGSSPREEQRERMRKTLVFSTLSLFLQRRDAHAQAIVVHTVPCAHQSPTCDEHDLIDALGDDCLVAKARVIVARVVDEPDLSHAGGEERSGGHVRAVSLLVRALSCD